MIKVPVDITIDQLRKIYFDLINVKVEGVNMSVDEFWEKYGS